MKQATGRDDVGFDLEIAKRCVDVYSSSIGIRCIIIDTYGKTQYEVCENKKQCMFCKCMQEDPEENQSCVNAHLYGSYQAERFGGSYVFFCPMGLAHWVSPIVVKDVMKGAIICGPVHMVDPEEFLIDEIIQKSTVKSTHFIRAKKYIKDIPVIKPEIVNSMSELLYITAMHISDVLPSRYQNEREFHEQQSDISEYVHHLKTKGGASQEIEAYPIEKEKELLSLISIGDKAGSQKLLNEIFGHIFFFSGGVFEVMKARVLELIVLLSRAAMEGGADAEQIFGLNYKFLNEINEFNTIEELTYWLSRIMVRFTDCVFNLADVKHVDVIYKAMDYIKKNYMRKITLEEVASYVYLSSSYFSKIFKDEMKLNFNSYLNQVRIEMSKKLLTDDSIPLVDISNLVGYEDQSYFSKVFKKIVGVTPGKYRESRGQLKVADL